MELDNRVNFNLINITKEGVDTFLCNIVKCSKFIDDFGELQ